MWTRAELKDNAKKYFKANYWKMVLVGLIMLIITSGSSASTSNYAQQNAETSEVGQLSATELLAVFAVIASVLAVMVIVSVIVKIFVLNPLLIGGQRFFVTSHYQKAGLGELGFAFSKSYLNVVKIMFLRNLFIALWSLLFIIPGIIKAFEYHMIPYILTENPEISYKEAFAMSKQMMTGNKWKTFVLDLSFLGWFLLSGITCGILAIFYVNPYYYMTHAELYVKLKEITFGGGRQNGYIEA